MTSDAVFYFALYKPECWALIKRDVAHRYPQLRLAFSRPGFATFKGPPGVPFAPWLVTISGTSLGKASLTDDEGRAPQTARYHWSFEPQQETWLGKAESAQTAPVLCGQAVHAIHLDRGGESAEVWLGLTEQPAGRSFVGIPVVPPANAPSRAYAKIVEVCAHFGIGWAPGEVVLELGAAPGGASMALLERGMHVVAVDPGEMAPAVSTVAQERGAFYRAVKKKASSLDRNDLLGQPRPSSWIVSDINLAPPVALTQLAHAYGLVKRSVRTLIWTCKINDDKAIETVPGVLRRLAELTRGSPQVAHLPSHRREFAVVIRLE